MSATRALRILGLPSSALTVCAAGVALALDGDDGFPDAVEVAAGTDPNDPGSFPVPLPALSRVAVALLAAALLSLGVAHQRAHVR